jgi:hypothetical protein
MGTTTLTLRLDEELKARLEGMAGAEDRSVSEYVVRSIKERLDIQCPACGRSSGAAVLPVGLSSAFQAWIADTKATGNRVPTCVATNEAGRRTAYWILYHPRRSPTEGMLPVEVLLDSPLQSGPSILVPLGEITGWASDPDGTHYARLCAVGYASGNEAVLRAAHARW